MKIKLKIEGMHCASCSKLIEMELDGKVDSSNIDFKSGKAIIEFDPEKISKDKIKSLIESSGYVVKNE